DHDRVTAGARSRGGGDTGVDSGQAGCREDQRDQGRENGRSRVKACVGTVHDRDSLPFKWEITQDEVGTVTTWTRHMCVGAAHDDAPSRSGLKAARISSANSCGSSQAAKWPPFSTSLK